MRGVGICNENKLSACLLQHSAAVYAVRKSPQVAGDAICNFVPVDNGTRLSTVLLQHSAAVYAVRTSPQVAVDAICKIIPNINRVHDHKNSFMLQVLRLQYCYSTKQYLYLYSSHLILWIL